MKILLGTAGIPDSAKDYSTIGGVKAIAKDGLQAMELAFVRQVYLTNEQAKEVGRIAAENNVSLSVHAPYYINLAAKSESTREASKKRILGCVERAFHMNAEIIAIHAGYYMNFSSEETFQRIKYSLEQIHAVMLKNGWENVLLGLETTGKEKQWGTLEEILRMCGEVKGCHPYIDFAHLFVKQNGSIDYSKILDKLEEEGYKNLYAHFEGVEKRNEKFVDIHAMIDSNPPFEPLAKELLKRNFDARIICESSVPETDALKMKDILTCLGYNF